MKQWLKQRFRARVVSSARWFVPATLANYFSNLAAFSRLSRWLKHNPCRSDFDGRYALYDFVRKTELLEVPFDYLEFGVYRGDSIAWWCKNVDCRDTRFFGFDCFQGLPEAWGSAPARTFDVGGLVPKIDDDRVKFIKGMFQDTFGPFFAEYSSDRRKVIHMDADLYSSTLFVLTGLAYRLRPGDIVIFDEFGSIRMAQHEFRAFEDFCSAFRGSFKSLGATSTLETVAMKVV
jgi:O-methyltransferase